MRPCFPCGFFITVLTLPIALQVPHVQGGSTELGISYTGDWLSNLDGGIRVEDRYLFNADITASINLARLPWQHGGTVFFHGSYNNGGTFSSDVVGDAQVVSNIEAPEALRLYQLYYQYGTGEDRADLLFGLWDLNSGMDVIEPAGLFLNSSHGIGAEFGTSGANGPSIFPVTSLALRLRYDISDHLRLRLAALDGVPGDPRDPDSTTIKLSRAEGALLAGEIEYRAGGNWLWKLGGWHYTSRFETLNGRGNAPARGLYASVVTSLAQRAGDVELQAFARAGFASDKVQAISRYFGAGLVLAGLNPGRTEDTLGIAVATAVSADDLGIRSAEYHETSIELTYSAQLTPWLRLQPGVQYIFNPGFDPRLEDALVFGLRVEASSTIAGLL